MKAAVARNIGQPLTIETVSLEEPGPSEVKVRIAAVAICQSDLAYIDGAWTVEGAGVFGHEASGFVERVGSDVSNFAEGDRVCVTLARACFACPNCNQGRPIDCSGSTSLDQRSVLRDADGGPLLQGLRTAAFAEQVLVDQSQVAKIPENVPWSSAAVLSCAVLTGFGAVRRTACFRQGQSALVIGTGGVGLNCVQTARIEGASHVIAVDMSEDKLDAARLFGATATLNPRTTDIAEEIDKLTVGQGIDRIFVCVGAPPVIEQALTMMAPGGAVVLVGMPGEGTSVSVDPLMLASANMSILGSKFGQSIIAEDIATLVDLYQCKRLKLDEIVTREFPFEHINDALSATRNGDGIRNVVRFDWTNEASP